MSNRVLIPIPLVPLVGVNAAELVRDQLRVVLGGVPPRNRPERDAEEVPHELQRGVVVAALLVGPHEGGVHAVGGGVNLRRHRPPRLRWRPAPRGAGARCGGRGPAAAGARGWTGRCRRPPSAAPAPCAAGPSGADSRSPPSPRRRRPGESSAPRPRRPPPAARVRRPPPSA